MAMRIAISEALEEKWSLDGIAVTQRVGSAADASLRLSFKHQLQPGDWSSIVRELDDHLGEQVAFEWDSWKYQGRIRRYEIRQAGQELVLEISDELTELTHSVGSRVFVQVRSDEALRTLTEPAGRLRTLPSYSARSIAFEVQYQETPLATIRRLLTGSGSTLWMHEGSVMVGACLDAAPIDLELGEDLFDWQFNSAGARSEAVVGFLEYSRNNRASNVNSSYGHDSPSLPRHRVDLHVMREKGDEQEGIALATSMMRLSEGAGVRFAGQIREPVPLGSRIRILDEHNAVTAADLVVVGVHGEVDFQAPRTAWWIEVSDLGSVGCDIAMEGGPRSAAAVVTEVNDDTNRVRVRFPWDSQGTITPWLRTLSPSLGQNHASVARLEKGDSVLVSWGQTDLDAVVLGAISAGTRHDDSGAGFVVRTVDGGVFRISQEKVHLSQANDATSGTVEIEPTRIAVQLSSGERLSIERGVVTILLAGGASSVTAARDGITLKSGGKIALHAASGIELKAPRVDVKQG